MAQSPQLDRVISLIRARATAPRKSLEEDRVSYETMLSAMTVDDDISTERIGAGGGPGEWIAAPGATPAVVMLYLHGGGYVLGSMRTHRVMLSHLARACQGKVLGLDYRLAPENPFPAPVDDTLVAYRWLLAQGYDHRQSVLAGDSAGGAGCRGAPAGGWRVPLALGRHGGARPILCDQRHLSPVRGQGPDPAHG